MFKFRNILFLLWLINEVIIFVLMHDKFIWFYDKIYIYFFVQSYIFENAFINFKIFVSKKNYYNSTFLCALIDALHICIINHNTSFRVTYVIHIIFVVFNACIIIFLNKQHSMNRYLRKILKIIVCFIMVVHYLQVYFNAFLTV